MTATVKPPLASPFKISFVDWEKLLQYANAAKDKAGLEISGMMVLLQDGEDWIISDPIILKQTCGAGETELDQQELANYYGLMATEHGAGVGFVWWHSHVNMAAFMSPTDVTAMNEFNRSPWTISLVVNVTGEYELRLNYFSPVHVHIKAKLNLMEAPENEVTVRRGRKIVRKYKETAAPDVTPSEAMIAEVNEKVSHTQYNEYSKKGRWDHWNGKNNGGPSHSPPYSGKTVAFYDLQRIISDLIVQERASKLSIENFRACLDQLAVMFEGDFAVLSPSANELADFKKTPWFLAEEAIITWADLETKTQRDFGFGAV